MLDVMNTYYEAATAILATGPHTRDFMRNTSECLGKTYIMMHSALGTDASLEIGAHNAEYSLEMANIYGGEISLCAIEASPRTHAYFSKKINYKDLGISYINALISDKEGATVFYEYLREGRDAGDWVSSLLIRDVRLNGQLKRTRTSVKSIRGDTLIESKFKNKNKIALWIDVEGAQYEVLNSLSKSFNKGIINSVYIEVERKKFWPRQKMLVNDVIEFMNKYNFSHFLRDNQSVDQYNIIFINNNIIDCNFSFFFNYYRKSLLKKLVQ